MTSSRGRRRRGSRGRSSAPSGRKTPRASPPARRASEPDRPPRRRPGPRFPAARAIASLTQGRRAPFSCPAQRIEQQDALDGRGGQQKMRLQRRPQRGLQSQEHAQPRPDRSALVAENPQKQIGHIQEHKQMFSLPGVAEPVNAKIQNHPSPAIPCRVPGGEASSPACAAGEKSPPTKPEPKPRQRGETR